MSQLLRFLLKLLALLNIFSIVVTLAVSQPPISLLKPLLFSSKELISVIPDVQHSAIFAPAVILATNDARSTFTYVLPPTSPISPTFASGHLIVTPLLGSK